MQLSQLDHERGRANYEAAAGLGRRDFLRASAVVPVAGAAYFGYHRLAGGPVRAAIVGTGNEGSSAMIDQSPPDYLQFIAYHDIRPSQIARGRRMFQKIYGTQAGNKVRFYDDYDAMLADKDVEVVVVATPLWTHADLTIRALRAGKDVLCEKLMAHNIADAKKMVRTADDTGRILSIGHQRHYSTLYHDALRTVKSGVLGDIRYLRAFWHRNNATINPRTGQVEDNWRPEIPPEDQGIDARKHGYKDVNELVRWRLYDRTGGGLMAELGSHQLDACSIFLDHARPVAVSGVGGKYYFKDDRDAFDHVYCTFEFPGGVVVTYSSINTNAMEGYGEVVMGSRGTLMVLTERDVLLFNEPDPFASQRDAKKIEMKVEQAKKGEATMYSAASLGLAAEAKAASQQVVSRGYKEELEHLAFCVRHRDPANRVRCDGRVALADAVMALTANRAIRSGQRIEFRDGWYDPYSAEVPEAVSAGPAARSA